MYNTAELIRSQLKLTATDYSDANIEDLGENADAMMLAWTTSSTTARYKVVEAMLTKLMIAEDIAIKNARNAGTVYRSTPVELTPSMKAILNPNKRIAFIDLTVVSRE